MIMYVSEVEIIPWMLTFLLSLLIGVEVCTVMIVFACRERKCADGFSYPLVIEKVLILYVFPYLVGDLLSLRGVYIVCSFNILRPKKLNHKLLS